MFSFESSLLSESMFPTSTIFSQELAFFFNQYLARSFIEYRTRTHENYLTYKTLFVPSEAFEYFEQTVGELIRLEKEINEQNPDAISHEYAVFCSAITFSTEESTPLLWALKEFILKPIFNANQLDNYEQQLHLVILLKSIVLFKIARLDLSYEEILQQGILSAKDIEDLKYHYMLSPDTNEYAVEKLRALVVDRVSEHKATKKLIIDKSPAKILISRAYLARLRTKCVFDLDGQVFQHSSYSQTMASLSQPALSSSSSTDRQKKKSKPSDTKESASKRTRHGEPETTVECEEAEQKIKQEVHDDETQLLPSRFSPTKKQQQ